MTKLELNIKRIERILQKVKELSHSVLFDGDINILMRHTLMKLTREFKLGGGNRLYVELRVFSRKEALFLRTYESYPTFSRKEGLSPAVLETELIQLFPEAEKKNGGLYINPVRGKQLDKLMAYLALKLAL